MPDSTEKHLVTHPCVPISLLMKEVIDTQCKTPTDVIKARSCMEGYRKFIMFSHQCLKKTDSESIEIKSFNNLKAS